jgi:hypothetical protein
MKVVSKKTLTSTSLLNEYKQAAHNDIVFCSEIDCFSMATLGSKVKHFKSQGSFHHLTVFCQQHSINARVGLTIDPYSVY